MFDKQLKLQLEKMLQQMSPKQKEKLSRILQSEESIKQAVASIDNNKAKDAVKTLNLGNDNIDKIVDEIKANPDIIKNLDKNM